MSYTTQECIFDTIAACGPSTNGELNRKCNIQVQDYQKELMVNALPSMVSAGLLEYDFETRSWDLSDYGYELIVIACHRLMPKD